MYCTLTATMSSTNGHNQDVVVMYQLVHTTDNPALLDLHPGLVGVYEDINFLAMDPPTQFIDANSNDPCDYTFKRDVAYQISSEDWEALHDAVGRECDDIDHRDGSTYEFTVHGNDEQGNPTNVTTHVTVDLHH